MRNDFRGRVSHELFQVLERLSARILGTKSVFRGQSISVTMMRNKSRGQLSHDFFEPRAEAGLYMSFFGVA